MRCAKCGKHLSDKEEYYSKHKFEVGICYYHQKELEPFLERSTPEAQKLFFYLLKKGIPAQIEKHDGYKTIDIAIPEARLNIEVDGMQHQNSSQAFTDLKRTLYSSMQGFETIRIPNGLIRGSDFKESVMILVNAIRKRINLFEDESDFDELEDELEDLFENNSDYDEWDDDFY